LPSRWRRRVARDPSIALRLASRTATSLRMTESPENGNFLAAEVRREQRDDYFVECGGA
jgi:hypothetical protein